MGRAARTRPVRLAEKLLQIREGLGLSQNELISRMGLENELTQRDISAVERGISEPTLILLLRIARLAGGRKGTGKYLEMLLDDDIKLILPKQRRGNAGSSKDRGETVSRKR